MSCFKLPKYFTEELENLIAKFWWKDDKGTGIHWSTWHDMCMSKDRGGIGFRNLDAFNMALLAKQAWCLLVFPRSLIGLIYKARYYSNTDIFDASLGSSPSYTWRSIWGAITLLERGSRWRVGNGAKASIWGSRWLPRPVTFKPITPRGSWPMEMKVNNLIDEDTGQWNRHVLESIFFAEDIKIILSIPLGSPTNEDTIIWYFNQNGEFSVRSAYHLAVQMELERVGSDSSNSSSSVSSKPWKWLWDLSLPSKIKIFLWRSCRNLLPTRSNLVKRKILESRSCELCGEGDEDVLHCISLCSFARQVWALSGVSWTIHWPNELSLTDWLLKMKKDQDKAQFEYCVVVCWALWNARNKRLFDEENESAMDIILFSKRFVMDLRGFSAVVLGQRSSIASHQGVNRWMAPPSDTIKINFDASLRSAESTCGLGGLARSSDGKCVAWFSYCLKQNLDPVVAEAMAALKAVEFALAHQFVRIILEGDSSTVVAAIRCKEGLRTSYGNLIADIKRLVTHFEEFEVCHVKRDGNRAAHEIARLSSMSTSLPNVLPAAILDIVMSDSQ